jgi:hypothetical protein
MMLFAIEEASRGERRAARSDVGENVQGDGDDWKRLAAGKPKVLVDLEDAMRCDAV